MVDLREPHHKSLMKKSLIAARESRFSSLVRGVATESLAAHMHWLTALRDLAE